MEALMTLLVLPVKLALALCSKPIAFLLFLCLAALALVVLLWREQDSLS